MADHDYKADIGKYTKNVDERAIKGIVKHLGIAVKSTDASMVACSDKSERDRVRDSFLKKKLALKNPDAELDKAIVDLCQAMKGDTSKLRVSFYYLLAEKYGKLGEFAA